MCYGIPYWIYVDFSWYHFWVGLGSAIINTLGLVAVANAFRTGPGGPVSAITSISNVILVVVEAIKKKRMPTVFELAGLVFGIFGSLVLVIPGYFRYWLCCLCCRDDEARIHQDDSDSAHEMTD